MHIGFVERGYPGPQGGGGAGTYVQILARELVALGHLVTVIAPVRDCPGPDGDEDGIRVYRPKVSHRLIRWTSRVPGLTPWRHQIGYLVSGRILARIVDQIHTVTPFDLVEYSEGGDYWHRAGRSFATVAHLHGSSYTFKQQSGKAVGKPEWRQRSLELRFIAEASWVFSPCQALLGIVEKEHGSPLPRHTVKPYPLDPMLVSKLPSFGRAGRECRVLFAARNDPVKGGRVLLEAASALRSVQPTARFEFYGFIPTPGLEMPGNVTANAFVPRADLVERYADSDICVIPSLWDNSPNTVYEAMAAGKPVVASAVGGIPEIVVPDETGFLVPPGDVTALKAALQALIDSPRLRERMGRAGRERIIALSEPGRNCQERADIYRKIIGCRNRQHS